jgi:hypothetical protein
VWSIFAGKISLAIPTAEQLTLEIQKHLDERDKKAVNKAASTT